jgi:hypothetical protein
MWLHTYDVRVCVMPFIVQLGKMNACGINLVYLKFGIDIIIKCFHLANLIFSHD